MAGAGGCVISLLSDVTSFTLAQNVSPWTTWELAPFSGFFRSPGWMILKQHSHLVLFLALSWAELSVTSNPTLSSAMAQAASGASLLTLPSTHSCSSCPRLSCLLFECLLQPSLLREVLHFSIFSPSFHVCTESVATRSLLWHPLSP